MAEPRTNDNIAREVRLYSIAYGLLGAGCLYVAFLVQPKTPIPTYVIALLDVCGLLLVAMMLGGLTRRRWVRPLAIGAHMVFAGLMTWAFVARALDPTARAEGLGTPVIGAVVILGYYYAFLRFWLSAQVKAWFLAQRPR